MQLRWITYTLNSEVAEQRRYLDKYSIYKFLQWSGQCHLEKKNIPAYWLQSFHTRIRTSRRRESLILFTKKWKRTIQLNSLIVTSYSIEAEYPWWSYIGYSGFEVLTAVVTKSAIFWDIRVTPCSPMKVNRRESFPHAFTLVCWLAYFSTLKMEAICSPNLGWLSTDYTALYPRRL
jgi:hypothetical protein